MKKIAASFAFALLLVCAFIPMAFAQAAINPDDAGGLLQTLFNAATAKNWRLVFALAVVLVTWALRTYGGKHKLLQWTKSDRGGAMLGMITGGATTVALGIMAGKPLDMNLVLTAFGGGVGVLGIFTLWKKGVLGGSKKEETPVQDVPPPSTGG